MNFSFLAFIAVPCARLGGDEDEDDPPFRVPPAFDAPPWQADYTPFRQCSVFDSVRQCLAVFLTSCTGSATFLPDPSGPRPVRDDDIAAFEQLMNEEKER
jgi:hypothetical protein